MLIKRDGVAILHADIEHVVGTNECAVITATEPATKSTIIITLLHDELLQIAMAYDDAIGADKATEITDPAQLDR